MTTVTEAIYENGALKLLNPQGLKEHQRYRVIVEEIPAPVAPNAPHNPALAAKLERRTTVLPDGRRVMNILGLFEQKDADLSFEAIEDMLNESRKAQLDELDELYGPEESV